MDPAVVKELSLMATARAINDAIDRGGSEVQQFYKDSTILISGGTGFMGKQLIEKLFRSCDIKKIFLIMRSKKNKAFQERLHLLLEDPVFDSVKKMRPGFEKKICPVQGDVADPGLGISSEDRATIIAETDIIIHSAAVLNFQEPLKKAVNTNVRGTLEMLNLGKQCKKLKFDDFQPPEQAISQYRIGYGSIDTYFAASYIEDYNQPLCLAFVDYEKAFDSMETLAVLQFFQRSYVHISTAYVTSSNKVIEEQFYEHSLSPQLIIGLVEYMDEKRINDITPELIQNSPNTYAFTKALAEEVVRQAASELPISVVRPGIVTPSYHEPAPGWLDSSCVFWPSGILLGAGLGVLHVVPYDSNTKLDFVPVDLVNNAIILAAWATAKRQERGEYESKIYNVTSTRNPIYWKKMMQSYNTEGRNYITPRTVYYYFLQETRYVLVYLLLSWLWHFIPGYIIDCVLMLMGKKPMAVKLYTKADKLSKVYARYLYDEKDKWFFSEHNTEALINSLNATDRQIFNCDINIVNWHELALTWTIGVRKYLLKDGLQSTDYAVRKQFWLKILHYTVVAPLYFYLLFKVLMLAIRLVYFAVFFFCYLINKTHI